MNVVIIADKEIVALFFESLRFNPGSNNGYREEI